MSHGHHGQRWKFTSFSCQLQVSSARASHFLDCHCNVNPDYDVARIVIHSSLTSIIQFYSTFCTFLCRNNRDTQRNLCIFKQAFSLIIQQNFMGITCADKEDMTM